MAGSNTITIGEIGREGTTAMAVREFLAQCDPMKPMLARLHSEGGEVFDGFAMYEAFKNYGGPKSCVIESAAFSIASYVAMAFDKVDISANGFLMLHNPWSMTEGDDAAHVKNGRLLSNLKESMIGAYVEKTGKTPEEIQAVMNAETYFNASDALAFGLVNSVARQVVKAVPFARKRSMPQRVFASLFEASVDGDNREPTKGKTMSESQHPVAATIKEIKRAFPKAKADFIVKCMEQEMPMPEVAALAVDETMTENQALMARVLALETEMAAMKASSVPEEEVVVAMVPEEEEPAAKAIAKAGVKPVAKARSASVVSAKAKWDSELSAHEAKGIPRAKALSLVNKKNPGLREQMVSEAS